MSAPLALSRTICVCKYRYMKMVSLLFQNGATYARTSSVYSQLISLNHSTGPHSNIDSPRLRLNLIANKSKVAKLTGTTKRSMGTFYGPTQTHSYILGIETSCDDTGAAVVDNTGNVIGESLNSQTTTHVQMGGIIPIIARDLHKQHICDIVDEAVNKASMSMEDIDGIAVTTEPGLPLSLNIGLEHAKMLARKFRKPLLPIHHMEAHALTVRMIQHVDFPYLVLLVSGGHCLLAVAQDVDKFLLLGRGLDDSPGDAFDKTARQMKLKNLKECYKLSGGAAVELLAKEGDPNSFKFPAVLSHSRDCNFSFAGLKFYAKKTILEEEERLGVYGGNVVPNAGDICASFQEGVFKHLSHRIRRGLLYAELKGLLPESNKTLVVSGGVASNMYIRQKLDIVCRRSNCRLIIPPTQLCTDNGIMIAWNGMERFKRGIGIVQVEDIDDIHFRPKSPLGKDVSHDVIQANIKVKRRLQ